MKKIMTLCIPQKENMVLLGMKKRGFGEGKWNGFGGKVAEGESIKKAARRELLEEAGLKAKNLEKIGIISFTWRGKEDILEVNVFKSTEFEGEPKESDEMKPEWFLIKNIPYDKMWSDDKYWLPLFLENENFKGEFLFDEDNQVLDYKLS